MNTEPPIESTVEPAVEPQAKARVIRHSEHRGEEHPEIQAGSFRELAGWVCANCWDGELRLPMVIETHPGIKKFVDQGIDLFYDSTPVLQYHTCEQATGEDDYRGVWSPAVFKLPMSFYNQLLISAETEYGDGVTTVELQTAAAAAGSADYDRYTPLIKQYHYQPTEQGVMGMDVSGMSRQQRRAFIRAQGKMVSKAARPKYEPKVRAERQANAPRPQVNRRH